MGHLGDALLSVSTKANTTKANNMLTKWPPVKTEKHTKLNVKLNLLLALTTVES